MLRIILADDHELIRDGLRPCLKELDPEVTVLEGASYHDVLAFAERANGIEDGIQLALVDLDMPGRDDNDPFASLRRVCSALPETSVVVVSASDDRATISAAIGSGARGFIPKGMRNRSLLNALRHVLAGEIYVPPVMAAGLNSPEDSGSTSTPTATLTAREAAALRLLSRGMTNKEIGRELGLQDVTIKMHLSSAFKKLGATNRVEAVRIATKLNLD